MNIQTNGTRAGTVVPLCVLSVYVAKCVNRYVCLRPGITAGTVVPLFAANASFVVNAAVTRAGTRAMITMDAASSIIGTSAKAQAARDELTFMSVLKRAIKTLQFVVVFLHPLLT